MGKTIITFGFDHRHRVNGKIFDKDCVAVIEADTQREGREMAFKLFGPQWCMEYFEGEWKEEQLRWFPRGYINVKREEDDTPSS